MNNHTCEAVVITCIDFRFQPYIDIWVKDNLGIKNHDRVALAGGVKGLETILGQVEISNRLHHIKRVILINHEDCGAYGQEGTAQKHTQDLTNAKSKIQEQFPNLEADTYYLHLNGEFKHV